LAKLSQDVSTRGVISLLRPTEREQVSGQVSRRARRDLHRRRQQLIEPVFGQIKTSGASEA